MRKKSKLQNATIFLIHSRNIGNVFFVRRCLKDGIGKFEEGKIDRDERNFLRETLLRWRC